MTVSDVVVYAWLGALTVLLIAVARYVATVRSSTEAHSNEPEGLENPRFRVDDDGPAVPSQLTTDAKTLLRQAGGSANGASVWLLFSIGCAPCKDRMTEISGLWDSGPPIPVFAMLAGRPDKDGTSDMILAFEAAGIRPVLDPVAHDLAKAMDLQSVPFAVVIKDDSYVAKKYLREGGELLELLEPITSPSVAGATSDPNPGQVRA